MKEKHVLWMLLFSVGMSVPLAVFNEVISQSYFYEIGFLQEHMKWIFPIIYGVASLTASQSHRIEKWIGETGSFILIIVIHSIGLLLMGLLRTPYAIIVVMITYISRDFRWVFGDTYINKYSQSGIRTTIMSIITMSIALVMSFTYTLGGFSVDYFGIQKTLLILAELIICASILLVLTKPKNNTKIEQL